MFFHLVPQQLPGLSISIYFILDGDSRHEIKRQLPLGRKAMANLDRVSKSKDITFPTILYGQTYGFSSICVQMWELDHKESWALKNWCFWIVMLEKTLEILEIPSDCKEIKTVIPKGNHSWIFTGKTIAEAEAPILWPPYVKRQLIGKDPHAGEDWGQEEKWVTEDKKVGWHH